MLVNTGDVLQVTVYGFVQHEGIVTEHGRVISNSRRKGCVFEESVRSFAEGRKIKNIGPLNPRIDPMLAVERARTQIGKSYDLVNDNCQHFVRWCYGLKPYSPQKRWALAGAAAIALIWAL